MNATQICTNPDVELHDHRALMISKHQRYIPMLSKGERLSVLSFHDVARTVFAEPALKK